MNKGLEEIRNPIGCEEFSILRKKYTYSEEQVEIIEKELKALDFIKDMLRNIGYTISLIKNEELVIQIGGKITIRLPKEYCDTLKEAGL